MGSGNLKTETGVQRFSGIRVRLFRQTGEETFMKLMGLSSSLRKALERFDNLSEEELSEIARRMIKGAIEP